MQKVFNIPTNISSAGFAVVAGLGLVLYTPAGVWSEKFGSVLVIRTALGIRWLAYIVLVGLGFLQMGVQYILPLLGFGFIVWAWSIISVSGTALAAQLSPVGEGEGLGIFNATNALAGVIGAALGGWVAGLWGYKYIAGVAVIGLTLGLLLSFSLSSAHGKTGKKL